MGWNVLIEVKGSVRHTFNFSLYPELGSPPVSPVLWDMKSHLRLLKPCTPHSPLPKQPLLSVFLVLFLYLPGQGLYWMWAYCYPYWKERRAKRKRALQRWTFCSCSYQDGSNNYRREDHLHLHLSYYLTSSSGRRTMQIENGDNFSRYW